MRSFPGLFLVAVFAAGCGGSSSSNPAAVEPRCGDGTVDPGEGCDEGTANDDALPGACRTDCVLPRCGDGVRDPDEGCDVGPENGAAGAGCTLACALRTCGDGTVQDGEECDDGAANSDEAADACRVTCVLAGCGDGVLDTGERCDEGVENSDVRAGACRRTCEPATCGDGVRDPDEGCDEGRENGDRPDDCRADCRMPACGDGIVDTGEGCDDGPERSDTVADACRTTCRLAFCGDGVVDTGEHCDEGSENDDVAGATCRTTCAPARCGDGVRDPGEACDEGAANSDTAPDACRTGCTLPACGDGVVDLGEGCDEGSENDDETPGSCRTSCRPSGCGDGVLDPGEGCDQGAANSDVTPDACRTTCHLATCGDGARDTGEECDEAEANSDTAPGACRTACVRHRCGDGVVDPAEGCDDGAANDDLRPGACRASCRPATCGDGVVDSGEGCDDGLANSDTRPGACRTSCALASCGDGVRDSGEGCDDGLANSDSLGDACRTDCTQATCGDGVVDAGEGCDDGTGNSDTLAGACRVTCVPAWCGDGVVDPDEACDDGGANGDVPNGCRTTCVLPYCGDGVVDAGEPCDDGAANDDLAPDACRTGCVLAFCGDGVVDEGEGCDGGMTNGTGTCRADCTSTACGDGILDPGEGCDDGNIRPSDGCSPTCVAEPHVCGNGIIESPEECDDGSVVSGDGCSHHCLWEIPTSCGSYPSTFVDLRHAGVPDGRGGLVYVGATFNSSHGATSACSTQDSSEVFHLYLPTTAGDLVVTAEPLAPGGYDPLLAVRRRCGDPATELGCTPEPAKGKQVLVVPGVSPTGGPLYIQVEAFGSRGKYRLRVAVVPPLPVGAACKTDESEGRCDPAANLGCADPDGDGAGTCRPIVAAGGTCAPTADVCVAGAACFPAGLCAPLCGNGRLDPGEQCDDGNTAAGDNCLPACASVGQHCGAVFDLTPGWEPATKTTIWRGDTSTATKKFTLSCGANTLSQKDAVGRFTAPETGTYVITLEDVDFEGKIGILQGTCGGATTSVACFDFDYRGTNAGGRVDLAAGQEVLVVVDGNSYYYQPNAEEGPFTLRIQRVACGDGLVAKHAEECEDGNLVDGDGCSAACLDEGQSCGLPYPIDWDHATGTAVWEGQVGGHWWSGGGFGSFPSCATTAATAGAVRFYAPFAGTFSFVLESDTVNFLALRNAACTSGTQLACAKRPADGKNWEAVSATLSAGQEVYLVFGDTYSRSSSESYGGFLQMPFRVTVAALACGDGRVVRPESCDDGNTVSGDGCSALCAIEPVAELEPNDSRAQAQAATVGRTFRGSLGGPDVYAVPVVAGERYVFETFVTKFGDCAATTNATNVDTVLALTDGAGAALAEDDDGGLGGAGHCSRIAWQAPSTGTYYLWVNSYAYETIGTYFVSLRRE